MLNESPSVKLQLGLEVCAENPPAALHGAKFGVLANAASVDRDWNDTCQVLQRCVPGGLQAVFSPQHGFWGQEQANMIETVHARDPRFDVPLYSLYSEVRQPTDEMLADLDALVIDLQDVGCRVYTFLWTVLACLRSCARHGLRVVVLDRPNPLGGEIIQGPLLETEFGSFVGALPMPMRHGLTMGEAARWMVDALELQLDLHVIAVRGWKRSQRFEDVSRSWVPTSPNLPTMDSVTVYPGQVLLEGTNLSEGRGTTLPFQLVGAPYIDALVLTEELRSQRIPGVLFRPVKFRPEFDKWAGRSCAGIGLQVTHLREFDPYFTAVKILHTVHRLWPDDFSWREPPYEYETVQWPIDIISGSDRLRHAIHSEGDPSGQASVVGVDSDSWLHRTSSARLYAE
ncbi:MAG: DUF1343 domain-containing protein [Planctomycetaceae bacterium]